MNTTCNAPTAQPEPAAVTLPDEDIILHRPQWFRQALAAPHETRRLTVDGVGINYLRWGNDDPARPGLLFVHGNGAHAKWFSFIAPLLSEHYNVAAMDLGGMGDSDWRMSYSRDTFAREIGEVALAAGLGPKPVIAGHSFGGFVSLIAAQAYGERLGGLILCDFTVRPASDAHEWFLGGERRRPTKIYKSFEDAAARFRLAPLQPCTNGFILDYIGPLSLRQVTAGETRGSRTFEETGWTWKFDASIFDGLRMGSDHADIYAGLACRGATMFGLESKDYQPATLDVLRRLAPEKPVFTVPGAQHHIMLDQPHAFAAAIGATMAGWRAEGALG
ncbi:MAG: alpha/beta hydrolase [Alphaproteobacteria bacterium HGW-Alphaproteobacteria-12]|nr:MAG: alpha/beta hydrolase [Alphaproteobacteria bacterium HGW-Alphaproteobacteria-12]